MSIITGKWWVRPAKTRIKNTILSWNWGSATKTVSQVPTSAICYELWSNQCNCQSNWPTFWRIFTLLSGAPALPGGSPGVSTKYKVDDRHHLLQWSSSCSSETHTHLQPDREMLNYKWNRKLNYKTGDSVRSHSSVENGPTSPWICGSGEM